MPTQEYRVTVNGLRVMSETWDDAMQWDGKRDEVFLSTSVSVVGRSGETLYRSQPTSPVLGDVNGWPGRIHAGSASDKGGLRTGDSFPTRTPWVREALDPTLDWPPCVVWQGFLTQGEDVALIAPSLWEWDEGESFLAGWVRWADGIAPKVQTKLPDLLGPGARAVVDAAALGLDIAVTLFANGGPVGKRGTRPIGMVADPANPNAFHFDPHVVVLNYDVAERLVREEPSGRGKGVLTLRYLEAPYYRGDYLLYLQVERVGQEPGATRLRSTNFPTRYVRHRGFLGELTELVDDLDRADSAFHLVPGLSDPTGVSFESVNFPGHYLRHQGFRVKLHERTSETLFALDATFRKVPGLADAAESSFESVNYPGHFLRHRGFQIFITPPDPGGGSFRPDATFLVI